MSIMQKEMKFFVATKDVDCNDVITPTAVMDYFQDIAGLHAAEIGVGYKTFKEKNYAWVILYQEFQIYGIPKYLDYVTVKTWPKPNRRLEFEREFLIEDKDGNVLIKGISNWVVIDLTTRNLVRTNEIRFDGEYYEFTNFPQKCSRKLGLDKNMIEDKFYHVVTYSDLDHNGHMNNTKYLNVIYNNINLYGTKKYIYDVKIAFEKEAKYLDTLEIGHYSVDGKEAYIGFVDNEVCFECLIGVK